MLNPNIKTSFSFMASLAFWMLYQIGYSNPLYIQTASTHMRRLGETKNLYTTTTSYGRIDPTLKKYQDFPQN